MSETNIRDVVKRTLALPVLLLLTLAIGLSVWIAHLLQSERSVQHSYDVIGEISQTQKLLIDQETGLRAYLLTADPVFLQPYIEGSRQFGPGLVALERETADNPGQARRIADVRQRYQVWQSYVERERKLIDLGQDGVAHDPATRQRLVIRKQQMDQMRATFESLRGEETRLLRERLETARSANVRLFTAGAFVVLIGAALLYLFLRAQLKAVDDLYMARVEESERARRAAEGLAAEVREQATAMEQAVLRANRERDQALGLQRKSEG
jgi:methyl-accepting chemotaxis protein